MICVTLLASTGGSLTNLEKTWNPGAQTLTFLDLIPVSVISDWRALRIVASRVVSWAPSTPKDLMPYCLRRKPPASLTSNSASLRLPAPKSTARNDFEFNITVASCQHSCSGHAISRAARVGVTYIHLWVKQKRKKTWRTGKSEASKPK